MVQFKLSLLTDKPEAFIYTFDFFNLDINYITDDKYYSSYLTRATAVKHWDIVPYLIERGINLDHQDYQKVTALMYSAYCGHLPTVGRLVLAGANMFLGDKDGDTALDNARLGQQRNECPNGNYEAVIDYLAKAMEIEDPKRVREAQQSPKDTKPSKYAAIAYNKNDFSIRTIVKDLPYSSSFQAIQNCNQISQQMGLDGENCESAAVFVSGNCGAYALSENHRAFGVGVSEYGTSKKLDTLRAAAEREALEQCQAKSNGASCNIKISDCQSH